MIAHTQKTENLPPTDLEKLGEGKQQSQEIKQIEGSLQFSQSADQGQSQKEHLQSDGHTHHLGKARCVSEGIIQGEGEVHHHHIHNGGQRVLFDDRLTNITEIYNVALSPTSISIAFDNLLKRNVILKKIFKNQLDELSKKQAILECEVTCKLDHFNLVKGYDKEETLSEYRVIMELVNDADYLQEKVENCHTPIKNELKLKSYITDVLNGLIYIHQQGYIHCDLKLANLFCHRELQDDEDEIQIRRVKIGDFGLMQKIDPVSKTAYIEETLGTFGFKAPEVKKGATIDQKADIWGLGIILYFLTVAYLPHHMKGYKYGQGPIPFRDFDWKKRSPSLKEFVMSMLSLDPKERPTAQEALNHPFLTIGMLD